MTLDETPKHDIVYVKFRRRKGIFSCPLCEIIDGKLAEDFNIETTTGTKKYTKGVLKSLIQKRLDSGDIIDFVLQKQGTPQSEEVLGFVTKYAAE